MGLDGIPDWFIHIAAAALARPVTHRLIFLSTFPVFPLSGKPAESFLYQKYRPIFITPILSRLMEKELVRSFLYPVLLSLDYSNSFCDQFAFRPTGSTTSALFHQITSLLQHNEYVHFVVLEFAKAFDSVRHTLISKISTFAVPDSFHNWLADNLFSRTHQTTVLENKSTFLPINASIIQGTGLGAVCYV